MTAIEECDVLLVSIKAMIAPRFPRPESPDVDYHAAVLSAAILSRLVDLAAAALSAVRHDESLVGGILARCALETTAVLYFLDARIGEVSNTAQLEELDETVKRLIFGTKAPLTTEEANPVAPFRVRKYMDEMGKISPTIRGSYADLSEFLHPNWYGTSGMYATYSPDKSAILIGADKEHASYLQILTLTVLHSALSISKIIGESLPRKAALHCALAKATGESRR